MQTKNYNLIPLSIDQGLNRVPIGTAGGYIRLLESPAAANVQIHLNEQNADGIPLKTYHAIEATNIEKIFVSCNAVAGEIITIVQANTAKDFKMVTPASDVKLSSLGSYESVALDQLDKIINPYSINQIIGTSTDFSETTVFSKTLNGVDKVDVEFNIISNSDIKGGGSGQLYVKLNDTFLFMYSRVNSIPISQNEIYSFNVSDGDVLEIVVDLYDTDKTRSATYKINEYIKK